MNAKAGVKRAFIEATVIKADGTRIPLGIVTDSRWKFQWDPRRLLAERRIRKFNQRNEE